LQAINRRRNCFSREKHYGQNVLIARKGVGRAGEGDLAGAGSFTTAEISSHAQTNMDVIKRFLPVNFLTEQAGRGIRVQIVREYAQP